MNETAKRIIINWSRTSTTHGLSGIGAAPNRIVRGLWASCVIIAAIGGIVMCRKVLALYFTRPVDYVSKVSRYVILGCLENAKIVREKNLCAMGR